MRIFVFTVLVISLPALAQDEVRDRVPVAPVIDASEIATLAISLVVVIAAILVVGWAYSRARVGGGAGNGVIDVVASRALGPKERLMVVQVADQQLLVGMTSSQLQTLHVFDAPVVDKQGGAPNSGFAGRLKTALAEIGR
ncbi:MAG: flagellar biosynthetic protein FliO [Woeseiaceae bacterium]|nr:flagellar biosynthetic protein FliO [Woeseiaceae bacterium]